MQQHHKSQPPAPLPSLDATADLILANHLISYGLNDHDAVDHHWDDIPTEHAPTSDLKAPASTQESPAIKLPACRQPVRSASRTKTEKPAQGSKPWDGEIVLNQNMEAVKSKKQKPRTNQQLRIRKMTKNAGGACSRHRRLKQFVSQFVEYRPPQSFAYLWPVSVLRANGGAGEAEG